LPNRSTDAQYAGLKQLAELTPIGWEYINPLLREIELKLGEESSQAMDWGFGVSPRLRPRSWILSLSVPWWTSELVNSRLDPSLLLLLTRIQAQVTSYVKVADDLTDHYAELNPAASKTLTRLLPLVFEIHIGLSKLFEVSSPFWNDFQRLLDEQRRALEWEISHRSGLPAELSQENLLMLGRKASLLRWPALAIPQLVGQADCRARVDGMFDQFFRIMQLLDDMVDVEDDMASRQPNAVAMALGERYYSLPQIFSAIECVADIAKGECRQLRSSVDSGRTFFAKTCSYLESCVELTRRNCLAIWGLKAAIAISNTLCGIDA
jgi:hypothetical protein